MLRVFQTSRQRLTTVNSLGPEGSIVDIFKIDCERCEWSTFQDWFSVGLDIRQVLVQVHSAPAVLTNSSKPFKIKAMLLFINSQIL
jgi:hypothetical protein